MLAPLLHQRLEPDRAFPFARHEGAKCILLTLDPRPERAGDDEYGPEGEETPVHP